MQVKICGIGTADAFDAAVAAGADWVGFNFFPRSPRYVAPAAAAALSARCPGGPGRVGLFVDPLEDDIAAVLDALRLDALQLYAGPARSAALGARFGLPVWRAIGVAVPGDLPATADGATRLLVESRAPAGATRPGGNATPFDWSIAAGWAAPVPWLLAGGLDPDNVAAAIAAARPDGVDVSSGVESTPGVKDPARIAAFIRAARAAA